MSASPALRAPGQDRAAAEPGGLYIPEDRQALSETDKINGVIRTILDAITAEWGVEVTLVELKDIMLPTA
ncbi:MAG: hypothetical protein ACM3ML_09270 [Micromonosporaceae bacterium]